MHTRRFVSMVSLSIASVFAGAVLIAGAPDAKQVRIGEPYALDVCVVSNESLNAMGNPVVKIHEGREFRFCCNSCVGEFEADPSKYISKVDEMMIARQEPYYPVKTCIVETGDALDIEGAHDISARIVWHNRFVRFCCDGCVPKFNAEPTKYLAILDAAVVDAQKKDYPLTTCVISGEKLGTMGHAVDKVYANRLVRFCCEPCVEEFEKDPVKYFRQIDAARKP